MNNEYYKDDISVLNNAGIWADYLDVSKDELLERKVWRDNRLITLKEAGIEFDNNEKPITPVKIKTGKKGRGLLGRYGPNHACDPIITRLNIYKLDIEFISVKRNDYNKWAIPGGMVDAGEKVSQTLKRELTEEAVSNTDVKIINKIFKGNETIIYTGPTYGDPRTTDNAWIETYVANYHINYSLSSKIKLTNQPCENSKVCWISCDHNDLFGDHKYFVKLAKKNAKKIIYETFIYYSLLYVIIIYNIILLISFISFLVKYLYDNNNITYYNYEL